MTEVVSVRFKNKGKVYYFDPNGLTIAKGDNVVVETAKGLEFAECVTGNHQVEENAVHPPLRPVERLATEEDVRRFEENRRREREAMEICRQRIAKHGLDMKLIDVEYNFEGSKILFFFTSEGRVDFRELVKDLASIFRTRIELRQIGVRDEARMLGGLGICGRPFCCAQFLDDFQPVSIKMAKTQGLSLNPTKISGSCGRLMCCLKYEQDAYEELVQSVPKTDAFVDTPAGKGTVVDVNLLKGTVRVRLEDQSDMAVKTFEASEVTVLGGKAKRARGPRAPRGRTRTSAGTTASAGTSPVRTPPAASPATGRTRTAAGTAAPSSPGRRRAPPSSVPSSSPPPAGTPAVRAPAPAVRRRRTGENKGYDCWEKPCGLFPTKGNVRKTRREFCGIHAGSSCCRPARAPRGTLGRQKGFFRRTGRRKNIET